MTSESTMQRMAIALICLVVAATAAKPARADDNDDARIAQQCPHFVAWKNSHAELSEKNRAKALAAPPTQPRWRQQLLDMVRADQAARDAWVKAGSKAGDGSDPIVEKVMTVDADNLKKLKPAIERQGFPRPAQVGVDGVEAAFLLVQHATGDPIFQRRVLPQLKTMYEEGLVSGQDLALLTDRTLRGQRKPQEYGTQFTIDDTTSTMKMQPVANRLGLDARRAGIGLPPLADYECILSVYQHKSVEH
jgi:D-alanyl-D-alanine carboxypeptidase